MCVCGVYVHVMCIVFWCECVHVCVCRNNQFAIFMRIM